MNNTYIFLKTGGNTLIAPTNTNIYGLTLPPGISVSTSGFINSNTQVNVSFTGSFSQIGTYQMIITATDDPDGASITATINITVTEPDIPITTIHELKKRVDKIEYKEICCLLKKINLLKRFIFLLIILFMAFVIGLYIFFYYNRISSFHHHRPINHHRHHHHI